MFGLIMDPVGMLNQLSHINISTYRPLAGSFYMDLPVVLKSPKKIFFFFKKYLFSFF